MGFKNSFWEIRNGWIPLLQRKCHIFHQHWLQYLGLTISVRNKSIIGRSEIIQFKHLIQGHPGHLSRRKHTSTPGWEDKALEDPTHQYYFRGFLSAKVKGNHDDIRHFNKKPLMKWPQGRSLCSIQLPLICHEYQLYRYFHQAQHLIC